MIYFLANGSTLAIAPCTFAAADFDLDCRMMATLEMAVTLTTDGPTLHLTDLDWDCFCWGEFDLESHRSPTVHVLLSCAISCACFETRFSPKTREEKRWKIMKSKSQATTELNNNSQEKWKSFLHFHSFSLSVSYPIPCQLKKTKNWNFNNFFSSILQKKYTRKEIQNDMKIRKVLSFISFRDLLDFSDWWYDDNEKSLWKIHFSQFKFN